MLFDCIVNDLLSDPEMPLFDFKPQPYTVRHSLIPMPFCVRHGLIPIPFFCVRHGLIPMPFCVSHGLIPIPFCVRHGLHSAKGGMATFVTLNCLLP